MDYMDEFSVILLAAGSGSRMGSDVKKQYMHLGGVPLLYYSLKVFEKSEATEVVLVVSPGDEEYVKKQIVYEHGFSKVSAIVAGGSERYLSVYEGLKVAKGPYVMVHDSARCCVTDRIVTDAYKACLEHKASVVGVPSVDTVKISDGFDFVEKTPLRNNVWSIQTPQTFSRDLLVKAYEKLWSSEDEDAFEGITDDAMVVERAFPDQKIKLVMGSYNNIKVTTPKDIAVAEEILK